MKRFPFFFVVGLALMLLVSCNNNPESYNGAEYTVMFYGVGGKDLDKELALNLKEALGVGTNDRVHFTAEIKFSKALQAPDPVYAVRDTKPFDPGFSHRGTVRLHLDPGAAAFTVDATLPLDTPLYRPDVIADYIKWTKEKFPARKYIMVLWDHGGGWLPGVEDDGPKTSVAFSGAGPLASLSALPPNRAVAYDDNLDDKAISISELVEGIKLSDTRMELVYYDACYMNMLENLGELREVAAYSLGAGHITPGLGGDYGTLLQLLGGGGGDTREIISEYCYLLMNHWNLLSDDPADITFTDLSKLQGVFDVVKKVADELVASNSIYGTEYYSQGIPVMTKEWVVGFPDNVTHVYNDRGNADKFDSTTGVPNSFNGTVINDGDNLLNLNKYLPPKPYVYFYDKALKYASEDYSGTEHNYIFADIYNYVEYVAMRSNNPKLITYASQLLTAANKAIIYGEESDKLPVLTTFSVTLINKSWWNRDYKPNGAYEKLTFDKATSWSKWLQINEALARITTNNVL
ncbi:hypothetical protein AGMMS49546_23490 [Spirochaetia bacterium]|nr:hypothetical protein AGMMS49546_23490 [Spirochaetia bacterium]